MPDKLTPTRDEIIEFSEKIEDLVFKHGYNYIEAVIAYCESIDLEVEVAVQLISEGLRDKIETDAYSRNLLKGKPSRLPL